MCEKEDLKRKLHDLEVAAERRGDREKLADLRLRRQVESEQAKASQAAAGLTHAAEAVRLAKDAVACLELREKDASVAKVAGWAATVCSSASESVARSATSAVSFGSAASAAGFALGKKPLGLVESKIVEWGLIDEQGVRKARQLVGRVLHLEDVVNSGAPFALSGLQRRTLGCAVAGVPLNDNVCIYVD